MPAPQTQDHQYYNRRHDDEVHRVEIWDKLFLHRESQQVVGQPVQAVELTTQNAIETLGVLEHLSEGRQFERKLLEQRKQEIEALIGQDQLESNPLLEKEAADNEHQNGGKQQNEQQVVEHLSECEAGFVGKFAVDASQRGSDVVGGVPEVVAVVQQQLKFLLRILNFVQIVHFGNQQLLILAKFYLYSRIAESGREEAAIVYSCRFAEDWLQAEVEDTPVRWGLSDSPHITELHRAIYFTGRTLCQFADTDPILIDRATATSIPVNRVSIITALYFQHIAISTVRLAAFISHCVCPIYAGAAEGGREFEECGGVAVYAGLGAVYGWDVGTAEDRVAVAWDYGSSGAGARWAWETRDAGSAGSRSAAGKTTLHLAGAKTANRTAHVDVVGHTTASGAG